METLFCPVCQNRLRVTHQDRYQDLGEHVSYPDRQPSMKDGYQCSDPNCFTHFLGCTWIEDGSIYVNKPDGMGDNMAHVLLKERCQDGIDSAIGSWQRSYDEVEQRRKKRTTTLNLYVIIIEIEPQYRQVFADEIKTMNQSFVKIKERYRWAFYRNKWNWYSRRKDGSYRSFSPFWEILSWKNSDFKENYHKALQRNREAMEKLMKIYNDTAYWSNTQKEPRFWHRAANAFLRLWYRERFEILKHTMI